MKDKDIDCAMDLTGKITGEDVHGAIARGWCHPENGHKELDYNLANAIAIEIFALLNQRRK